MAQQRLYCSTLVLAVGVISLLLAQICVLDTRAREDAAIIRTQEAHIARFRAYVLGN